MTVGLVAGLVLLSALVSRRLVDGPLTPPAIFALAGAAAAAGSVIELDVDESAIVILAEATLSLVLFVDAARIPLGSVRRFAGLPMRLLGIALPLAVVFGTVVGRFLLDLEWAQAVLLGAALAATDAALGRVVISSPDIPPRISQSVNVESGLNDGMVVPVITFATGVVAAEAGQVGDLPLALVRAIGFALAAGALTGWAAAFLLTRARDRDLVDGIFGQLATAATPALAYVLATALGGNAFIAVYSAGAAFGWVSRQDASYLSEFSEDAGRLLTLVAFFVFGAALLEPSLRALDWRIAVAAVVFLTVVRMAAVAVSLAGTGLKGPSVAYLGWFGPRGLASILFAFLLAEELGPELAPEITTVIAFTVMLSMLAHGATAGPFSSRYAAWYRARVGEGATEGGMQMPEDAPRTRT